MTDRKCPDNADADVAKVLSLVQKTATRIRACGESIRHASDTIMRGCDTPGSKGAAFGEVLREKSATLRNLAALCDRSAKQLLASSWQLRDGRTTEDVLWAMLNLARSLGDQMRSEERDARRILAVLRPGKAGAARSGL